MKKTVFSSSCYYGRIVAFSQIPSYYNDVNLTLTVVPLLRMLYQQKLLHTHTTDLSYTPAVWDALATY